MAKVKVLVRHTFDIEEMWEEEYATKDHIEFYYNDGTSCADNILDSISQYQHSINKNNEGYGTYCLCHVQKSEVLKIYEKEVKQLEQLNVIDIKE